MEKIHSIVAPLSFSSQPGPADSITKFLDSSSILSISEWRRRMGEVKRKKNYLKKRRRSKEKKEHDMMQTRPNHTHKHFFSLLLAFSNFTTYPIVPSSIPLTLFHDDDTARLGRVCGHEHKALPHNSNQEVHLPLLFLSSRSVQIHPIRWGACPPFLWSTFLGYVREELGRSRARHPRPPGR